jgi:hypothetical protein
VLQVAFESVELANPRTHLVAVTLDQLEHVSTWRCASIADTDDFSDLGERKANGLRCPYERQARQGIWLKGAVARGRASGLGQ